MKLYIHVWACVHNIWNVVINVKIMATNPKMVELGFLVIFNFFLTLAYIDWNFQSEHPLSMLS